MCSNDLGNNVLPFTHRARTYPFQRKNLILKAYENFEINRKSLSSMYKSSRCMMLTILFYRGRGRPDYREYRRYSPDRGPPVKRMRQEWGEDGRPLRYGGKFRLGNYTNSNKMCKKES